MVEKKKVKKKPEKNVKKEEVCTTFKVSDGEKEKLMRSCGEMEKKSASEKEIQSFSRVLFNTLAFLTFLLILFFSIYYISSSSKIVHFKGVEYRKLQVGEVLFYHAQIPYLEDLGGTTKYNIYFRSNPKKISKNIPLDGDDISWKQLIVTNYSTGGLACEGDSIIA